MSPDKFGDTAGFIRSETFFEVINTVIFAGFIWQALDAVEIVALEAMLDSVFDHVPLDQILGVVVFHVFLITTGKQIYHLIAVEHEHGGR